MSVLASRHKIWVYEEFRRDWILIVTVAWSTSICVVVQIFAAGKRESKTFQGRIDWSPIDNLGSEQQNIVVSSITWEINNKT